MRSSPRAILAVDISPFGDSLTLVPALQRIKERFPGSALAAAASSGTCELLSAYSIVHETFDLGVIKDSTEGLGRSLKNIFKLAKSGRRANFDLVLDFSSRFETFIALRFGSGAQVVTPDKMDVVINLISRRRAGTTAQADRYSRLLSRLRIEGADLNQLLQPTPESSAWFEGVLDRQGSRGGEPLVVLYAADAGALGWPADQFVETGVRLTHNFRYRVVAVDVPYDTAFTSRVAGLLPETAIKVSSPRAFEVVSAVARASLLLTDDTGLARTGVGLGTPVIELTDAARAGGDHRHLRVDAGASVDDVYLPACEILQRSRTESLFQR